MPASVTRAVEAAVGQTSRILFKPFDLAKWCALGFAAWLIQIGDGGVNFNFNQVLKRSGTSTGGRPLPTEQDLVRSTLDWIQTHPRELLAIVLISGLLVAIVITLLQWLSSRAHFMLLDGLSLNRGLVREPWREYRAEGNSLFWFRVWVAFPAFLLAMAVLAGGVVIAWPDINAWNFGPSARLAVLVTAALLLPLTAIYVIIYACLRDFVVPIMYLRRCTVLPAWGIFRDEVLRGNVGPLVLFYLMKILLFFAVAIAGLVVTCLTCCIAVIPYVGTVILLPLIVFLRNYSLCFLEQLGPQWQFFRDVPPPVLGFEIIPRQPE